MEHSNYSPSRLSRIIKCPGSVNLIDSLLITKTLSKSSPSSYAEHGTLLHKILAEVIECENTNLTRYVDLIKDDQFLIRECVDYLEILLASIGHQNFMVKNETHVSLSTWGIPDVWGTSDYQVIDPIKRHIDIIDWKFGAGVQVYAKENPQLLAYAAGAIRWPTQIQTVTLHVVQPAIENFDTYDVTIDEMYNWVHGTLAIAINKCASAVNEFNPGIEQCRWCEAKNHCRTRLDEAQDIAIRLFEAAETLATCPNPEELVRLINKAAAVERAIKDIRLYIQTDMMKGIVYPGLKLVTGRSNRSWINEKNTIKWLAENTEIEELFNSKLLSPSQIEKEVKTLKKNKDFMTLYNKPPGKIALVPDSDPRPALQTEATAIDVFANVELPEKLE